MRRIRISGIASRWRLVQRVAIMAALDGGALENHRPTIRLPAPMLRPKRTTEVGTTARPTDRPQRRRGLIRARRLIPTAGLSRGRATTPSRPHGHNPCRSLHRSYASGRRHQVTAADIALLAASRRPAVTAGTALLAAANPRPREATAVEAAIAAEAAPVPATAQAAAVVVEGTAAAEADPPAARATAAVAAVKGRAAHKRFFP